jgi:hypothetical protein
MWRVFQVTNEIVMKKILRLAGGRWQARISMSEDEYVWMIGFGTRVLSGSDTQ